MLGNCLENVRKSMPLVHNITNYVTVNDVANAILACGGSPIMSDEPDDVADITSICGGLNINIGTLNKRTIEAMWISGARSKELGHPVLLDPVGAGASALRTNTAVKIMEKIKPDVIRGNISEIKTLALGSGTTKGVDADAADTVTEDNLEAMISFAKNFAAKSGAVVAITGAIDLVADAETCYVIRNGRPEMSRITGTGCQLSGITATYITANPDHKTEAVAAAVCMMGLAGEIGVANMAENEGNSSLRNRIIDAIYNMDAETLDHGAKYEVR
ncbi:MAG: hydroxyethylthiazole kinase [Ruminococcaceae bacterium]|nr:hydroxyethylthiazole kinase [Oscillospiraceae bacterium]